ncbi:MAG: carboxymuconolactone decarboxylase family protein [Hoeflea sp.]|uniref:carboxymuconolactone decarboxylase family protein n=1 Tax=Hoeflea sp. TaxID=1940281 RepID=UPI001E06B2A3|nr:carboxymuconolactone decarboxylase family protein [Hoeflea sp.]MBU4530733.1 carboxymuconolactone decarboxylase family protein [Alphaproteobacteria bacterium]MBU4544732.1 carboxymuconolactone decarboxylase family protein [Alphaproteobacteria bacterium]MBU4549288.1 carboxymuconolactone decarboxylase family protein [Alphaproteobacteria bacterium]MBV1726327.1 carboxymuconolactone decarboxylase family protein [Hoeflea sp.]MBV1761669.1 carboxymuconolactone decarboxylase family protein [Hoeflea sp
MIYPANTIETAPLAARPILTNTKAAMGFVPNLFAVMSNAPAVLEGYTTLAKILESSTLNATERQIVLLASSYENGCEYCMAVHTTLAGMQKVPSDIVNAIRDGQKIANRKYEAIRSLAASITSTRGWPNNATLVEFYEVGYGPQQVLEVILGIGLKTISNYTAHLADTKLDDAFQAVAWKR